MEALRIVAVGEERGHDAVDLPGPGPARDRDGPDETADEGMAASLKEIPDFQKSVKFYRMEAESWLSKAGGAWRPKAVAPTPTPF